jgi:DUF4097 and DUF4098 domain-containing protein YvlB
LAMQSRTRGSTKTTTVIIILVIVVVAVAIAGFTAFFLGPSLSVTKKNFTPYSTPVSQNSSSPSSVTVVDVNGGITFTPWTQSYLLINGTTTARGINANPDMVTFIESNTTGEIVFQAMFPPGTFFFTTSYTVDINIYTPASYQFKTAQATTTNGDITASSTSASTISLTTTNGQLSASTITASSLTLSDTNGAIDFTCNTCNTVTATTTNGAVTANLTSLLTGGTYTITSTNGNISLKIPSIATNFKITASTTNGSVSSTGLSQTLTNHVTSTFGTGSAVVLATTTNGSISVNAA